MGLLTDPSTGQGKFPELLVKYHVIICFVFYFSGLAWFSLLAYKPYNAGTYFSENALLPGLVKGDFSEHEMAQRYLDELNHEAARYENGVPYPWLTAAFKQLGLDTYTHNFTLHYPFGSGTQFIGKNVYAILRAPRSSSTEAVILSAPYRPPSSVHTGTAPSIALMLALAKFFRRQIYWAKDIIFIVTDHEQLGMQAWLEAYHQQSCGEGILNYGDLEGRSGAIQAAINLELHADKVSHLDVKLEGLNGQLPNLDLSNLIHRLCMREGVRHTFKGTEDFSDAESYDGWKVSLSTLLSMVMTQSTGVPNGNHGLFHRFGIEALTIESLEMPGWTKSLAGFHQVGRVLEGTFRSLNNLLERFHQSYFFYLLPATNRYISIGVYMPPFAMIAGALLIMALTLWFQVSEEEEAAQKGEKKSDKEVDHGLLAFAPTVLLTHAIGATMRVSPEVFSKVGAYFGWNSEDAIYYGFMVACIFALIVPVIFRKHINSGRKNWKVLKCLGLLELATLLFSVSMYNISMALLVAAMYVPIVTYLSQTANRIMHNLQRCFLLLIHPLILIYVIVIISTVYFYPEMEPMEIFWKAVTANKRAVMYSIIDGYIYGNWAFDVACGILLPIWLQFWFVVVGKW